MEALNLLLLAGGVLVFTSLLAGVYSTRLGFSFLLVFLVAGMLAGEDGPGGIRFDSPLISAWVGNAALAIILLEGGLNTHMSTFRSGLRPGLLLATVGVGLTAAIVAAVAMPAMQIDWRQGLLLGAIVGSTDAAAVFSVLRHAGLRLHERIGATLEVESGLNDPMAVFLVLVLVGVIAHGASAADAAWLFVRQAGIGWAVGWLGGAGVAWLLRRLPLSTEHGGLLSLVIVSGGMVLYAACGFVEGSGFLAVYLYGLRVRALAETAAHAASSALDGFAWAAQATMFLLLGLLVSPRALLAGAWHTVAIALVLMLVARPAAVLLCLAPQRFGWREMVFVGWVGLRGAVPIVLALIPVLARVPGSDRWFNVAFAVVLASLLLQGTTLPALARRLRLVEPPEQPPPGEGQVHGRLLLDADLPLADVFGFFQLPLPPNPAETLGEWMTQTMARDRTEGDGLAWHGAHFRIAGLQDGRIARVGVTLAPRPA